jgi:hypothetical protein
MVLAVTLAFAADTIPGPKFCVPVPRFIDAANPTAMPAGFPPATISAPFLAVTPTFVAVHCTPSIRADIVLSDVF